MKNNFKELLTQYENKFILMVKSENLEDLKNKFSDSEGVRESAINWVFENIKEEEEMSNYFSALSELEEHLFYNHGDIPAFGTSTFDEIEKSFNDYESYYQRYGCMLPEMIVSWDDQNVLFTDGGQVSGSEIVEIVPRADVLMNQ